jgi:hypothetical protein
MNNSASTDQQLDTYIAACESRCGPNDDLPAVILQGQGYHTTMPNGSTVHHTRDALDYALALFTEGGGESVARAIRIVRRVLEMQDRDICSRSFGIWPWFFEEPISAMRPPDWNWADFIGVRLAHILRMHGERLPEDLCGDVAKALEAAAFSIFRRNVGPEYTNISVKGGVVTVMAGEQLGQPVLLAYGRRRLARFLEHTRRHGGFNEYNSPTYGVVVLVEVERGLLLVKDAETRTCLTAIHELCWRLLAASLHLPTGQICGPHARSYEDLLRPEYACLFGAALGERIFVPSSLTRGGDGGSFALIPRIPCPEPVRREIRDAPTVRFVRQDYVRTDNPEEQRRGTHWFGGDACIGSVNLDNLWQQRRPIIGYWRVGDEVAVLRVRLTHGGADFASGSLRTVQEGAELLSLCSLVTNRADSHDHLDMPPDGIFRFDQLALSIELSFSGATVRALKSGGFELSAGDHAVTVSPLHAEFGTYPVVWTTTSEDGKACVRAVVNDGQPVVLQPAKMKNVGIGFHLALHRVGDSVAVTGRAEVCADSVTLVSESPRASLALTAPRHPVELRQIKT